MCHFFQRGWFFSELKKNTGVHAKERFYLFILRLIPARLYSIMLHRIAALSRKNKTGLVCSFAPNAYGYMNETFSLEMLGDGNRKMMFEKKMYPVAKDVEKYLEQIYGDYMELPPLEKRIQPHNNVIQF